MIEDIIEELQSVLYRHGYKLYDPEFINEYNSMYSKFDPKISYTSYIKFTAKKK